MIYTCKSQRKGKLSSRDASTIHVKIRKFIIIVGTIAKARRSAWCSFERKLLLWIVHWSRKRREKFSTRGGGQRKVGQKSRSIRTRTLSKSLLSLTDRGSLSNSGRLSGIWDYCSAFRWAHVSVVHKIELICMKSWWFSENNEKFRSRASNYCSYRCINSSLTWMTRWVNELKDITLQQCRRESWGNIRKH